MLIQKMFYYFLDKISFIYDFSVYKRIGNYRIKMNISHKLPRYLKQYPLYSQNLGRILNLLSSKIELKIIDVGANVGDSIALIRSNENLANTPILAIEGDKKYLKQLFFNKNLLGTNIIIEDSFIKTDEQKNYIIKNKDGSARLQAVKKKSDIKSMLLSEIIDLHPLFDNFNFIKIDTDGFDVKIIKSSKKILLKNEPILFFEYDPFLTSLQDESSYDIFLFLKSIGYKYAILYDNFGKIIMSIDLNEENILKQLHRYAVGNNGQYYYDICVFPGKMKNIFDYIVSQENIYYDNLFPGK